MKINKLIIKLLLICSTIILGACSDFLNQVPDDAMTVDDIFKKKRDTERYLANVYSYIPSDLKITGTNTPLSDELDITFSDYQENSIVQGQLTPSKGWRNSWNHFYKGIRSASYFIHNVDRNMDPDMQKYKQQYKQEARALRAYYYFLIFSWHGPFVIMPSEVMEPDTDLGTMSIPRSSVDECVEFMIAELDKACTEGLPELPENDLEYGRITIPIARAMQSRILLYAASELWNGNTRYSDFKNKDGKQLVSQSKDVNKWKRAAEAAKDFIDTYSQYSLYTKNIDGVHDPLQSYQYLFLEDWNNEVIFARGEGSYWDVEMNSPRFAGGWSGFDPTQEMVDAYFTVNGLPIKDEKWADKDPSYSEVGTITVNTGNALANTYNMYVNRDPRFYVSICYDNSRWVATSHNDVTQLYFKGNSGHTGSTRNYSQTGYILRKFNNPASSPKNNRMPNRSMIVFRLGEIYLNYAEALNEWKPGDENILKYVNLIRERVGLPGYGNGSGQVILKSTDQDAVRQLIRAERRVELAFENHRYQDCIRWNTATEHFAGPIHGMDVGKARPDFYTRSVVNKPARVFEYHQSLWPIYQDETYKNKNLVQNPGWDSVKDK